MIRKVHTRMMPTTAGARFMSRVWQSRSPTAVGCAAGAEHRGCISNF
jgi:hypothetical protein